MARRIVIAALGFALIAALALASSASGASRGLTDPTSAGALTIKLDKRAAKSLRRGGVKLLGTGAASAGRRMLIVPVSDGTVGSTAQLTNAGGLKLTARTGGKGKRRVAKLRQLRTVIADGSGYVTARLRGQQVTLLRLGAVGDAPFDPLTGHVGVVDTPVKFERSTASALAERLGVERLRSKLGSASIDATVTPAPAEQTEAPVRPRPAGAVDVVSATLTWRARVSWVDYLHAAGDQGGTRSSNGATDGPTEVIPPSTDARVYQWDFPFASGWFDAASDTATVGFNGTVTFFKLIQPFNIDLDASKPEIELGGAEPRAIFTLDGRGNNADQQNRRAVVVDLDQAAVSPVVSAGPGGTTYTWTGIPGLVPDGSAAWPIAGYYQPGDAWGSLDVSFTVAP